MIEYRVFCGWKNGAYINSLLTTFHQDLNELIKDYGQPDVIEIRKSMDGEYVTG